MILDYPTLKVIWWLIFCIVVIAFMISGGMDFGVNFLLPVVGKNDQERREILNSTGPTWEGNQVWLILLIAGLLAIWPTLYATLLYSMYFLVWIIVFTLVLRPPGFDYRNKINSSIWRTFWDLSLFVGAILFAFATGLIISCQFEGIPYYFDDDMRIVFDGGILQLVSPLTILCATISLSAMVMQGGLFLQYKLPENVAERVKKIIKINSWVFNGAFIFGIYCLLSNKWGANYMEYRYLLLLPICSVLSAVFANIASRSNRPLTGLVCSSFGIATTVFTVAAALFPYMLTSNLVYSDSLTIWSAAASYRTLSYTLWAIVVFLPIVLIYTAWVYRVMRGKVKLDQDSY